MKVRGLCLLLMVQLCWLPVALPSLHISGFGNLLMQVAKVYGINVEQLANIEALLQNSQALNKKTQTLIEKQQAQWLAMTGHSGIGDLWVTEKNTQWPQQDWQSVLAWASGNNPGRMQELLQKYQQQYPSLEKDTIVYGDRPQVKAQYYQDNVSTVQVAMASATMIYDDLRQAQTKLQQLLSYIEKTDDLKAAMDLNNRILLELSFNQLNMLRLQSIQTQLLALGQQRGGNVVTSDTNFLTWEGES